MSKLSELIDKRIDDKLDSTVLKYAPAVVLAVGEEYKRADVRLLANGAVIKNILNKTKEELSVGDSVRVAYFTLPSAGWIDFVNGEARPIGGGAGIEVASAAILTDTTAADFIIDREVMIDYSPQTKVLYGSSPSFIVVNGMYVYYGDSLTNTSAQADIIAHTELFGGGITLSGVAYDPALTDHEYNVINTTFDVRIESMSKSGASHTESAGIYLMTEYGVPSATVNRRYQLLNNFVYSAAAWAEDLILIPRVSSIFQSNDPEINSRLPDGVTYIMEVTLECAWKVNGTWTFNRYANQLSPYSMGLSTSNSSHYYVCFANQAEQDFALGVTQRSEPVEVTS